MLAGYLTGNLSPVLVIASAALSGTALVLLKVNHRQLVANSLAVLLMGQVMLMVGAFRGHPWQVDMHMYFFATLAMLTALINWPAILFATLAVAAHHLVLNLLIPVYVFPDSGSIVRMLIHAVILLTEAATLMAICMVIRSVLTQAEISQRKA